LFIYLDLFICQELTLAFRHPWLRNIILLQYLFIAILCVKMSRVNKVLGRENEEKEKYVGASAVIQTRVLRF